MTDDKLHLDIESLTREHELYENPLTEKQRAILEAAERLFTEWGYAETSTAKVAKEAGVTEKTLFKHFPTKLDLFRRVLFPLLLRTFVPLQIQMVKRMLGASYASYAELVRTFALDRWSLAGAVGPRVKLVAIELLRNDKLREELRVLLESRVWGELVKTIERFQEKGELRRDLAAVDIARAQIILVAGNALLRGVLAPGATWDDAKDAERLASLLFDGVRAR